MQRIALIPYLTAGYPTRDASLSALTMVAEAGADFVEIGIPFTDPLADGPVIQRSTQVALEGGMTVGGMLELVREAALDLPVIAFGYLNPILAYGLPRFLDDAAEAGIAGLLLTDLPGGEDLELESAVRRSDLALIPLVAPTTHESRVARMLRHAEGFVYVISRLGVTGPATTLDATVEATVARVRKVTDLPVAVGFGIATGEQAVRAAGYADGVVVGSALVRCLADGLGQGRMLMEELRSALDQAAASPRAN
ncbi:MAG: tryptophan synthase subunit alpha [Gemmatimonadales bacterium]|nr:tryptophan synthase subunit alpha [Gemmatimonadales bacterium]